MTTPTPSAESTFTPSGHPVRNVSIVLGIVVVILVVAWAGGLVTPRFSVGGGTGRSDIVTREGTLAVQLRNEALAAVEIQSAEIVAHGVTDLGASHGTTPLDDHPMLDPGETRPVRVRYEVTGCPDVAPPGEWEIRITTRTALALTRTVMLSIGHMAPTAACP